jgi:hypothetical protein
MVVTDDLARRRVTVFFRLILAIPLLLWLSLWGLAAVVVAFINWIATLIKGQSPAGMHRFLAAFINYNVHVNAYLYVAAQRYPEFGGEGGYTVDVQIDGPHPQRRWTVALRLVLAIPVLILAFAISGAGGLPQYGGEGDEKTYGLQIVGLLGTSGVICWFYALFKGRAPEGVTRLIWYALHYGAHAWAYIFVLTDRYPNSDPALLGVPRKPPPHPVALTVPADELERSRLTVFFRLLLAFPHLFWATLWGIAAIIVAFLNWIVTLVRGRSPESFHRFLAAWVRYWTHVTAFISLVANPFPGFAGAAGSYPVDLEIPGPERQGRVGTAFRLLLVIPAAFINSALGTAMWVSAFLGWWVALFTGRMPRGLRNLGALAIRYGGQVNAFALLLTDRYPYAGPPADAASAPEAPVAPVEPWAPEPETPEPPTSDDPRAGWRNSPFVGPSDP